MSDDALVQAAQTDPQAFAHLYEKYVEVIYRFIFFRTGRDTTVAEDLTADVFAKALQYLPGYRDQGHPYSTYLYSIARTICVDYYRRQAVPVEDIETAVVADTGNSADIQADIQLLWEAIRQYDPKVVEIFELRYLEGLPFEDIAKLVGKSPGAIRTVVSRTINELKQAYD